MNAEPQRLDPEPEQPFGALASDIEGLLDETKAPVVAAEPEHATVAEPETRVLESSARSAVRALVITTEDVLTEGSPAQRQAIARSAMFEELHIVVCTTTSHPFATLKIAPNAWVYPTNSRSSWRIPLDAYQIARKELYFAGTFRADVIAADDPFLVGLIASALAHWFARPLHVSVAVDPESDAFLEQDPYNDYWRLGSKIVLWRAARVRAYAEELAAALRERSPRLADRIDVIPRAIDVRADVPARIDLHKAFPKFTYIILIAGVFDEPGGIVFGLNATQHLLKQYPSVGLVIAGRGDGLDAIPAEIAARQLGAKVALLDLSEEDLVGVIKTADTLLVCEPTTHESIVSAAAVGGVPIIAVASASVERIVAHEASGLLFVPGDLGSAITSINRYLNDSSYRRRMAMAARDAVANTEDDIVVYNDMYRASLERAILGDVRLADADSAEAERSTTMTHST